MVIEPEQVFSTYTRADAPAPYAFCDACGSELAPIAGTRGVRCTACGRSRFQNPVPAVSVLVARDREVLLCRRKSRSLATGQWCLPCGYIEHHEDFLSAGQREVREETGLDVRLTGILSVVTNYFSPTLHSLVIVLVAEPVDALSTLEAGDDADDARWFSLDEALPDLAFDADLHIITRYFEAPFAGAPIDPRFAIAGLATH